MDYFAKELLAKLETADPFYAAYEEGAEGREHFGDETADIMFSLVNLARHAGVTQLPAYEFFEEQLETVPVDERSVVEVVDGIADQINGLLETAKTKPEGLEDAALAVFNYQLS
jgi:hypothetical protein